MIGIVERRHFCTNLSIDNVSAIDCIGINVDGVVAKVDRDAFHGHTCTFRIQRGT